MAQIGEYGDQRYSHLKILAAFVFVRNFAVGAITLAVIVLHASMFVFVGRLIVIVVAGNVRSEVFSVEYLDKLNALILFLTGVGAGRCRKTEFTASKLG